MQSSLLLEFLKTLAALWHVVAFAGGFAFVLLSYRALFGHGSRDPLWGRIIRNADVHLWGSGFVIIGLGLLSAGPAHYLSNPKLWAKCHVLDDSLAGKRRGLLLARELIEEFRRWK